MTYKILSCPFLFLLLAGHLLSCKHAKTSAQSFTEFMTQLELQDAEARNELVETYLSQIKQTPVIEPDGWVHFLVYTHADSVYVQGDLQNGWAIPHKLSLIPCGDKNLFYKSYQIPKNSQIEYQLVVDGKMQLDSLNPDVEANFEYGDRNIFHMPEFIPSPFLTYRQDIKKGVVFPRLIQSKTDLFMDRKIQIYLPAEYQSSHKYPVILIHDGEIKLFTTPIKNVLDNLISEDSIQPIIAVFIPAMERNKEYCDQNMAYCDYLIDEVVGYIKSNFSTQDSSQAWATMGASGGGMISMALGLLYPDKIGNVAAQGGAGALPNTWCNDEQLYAVYAKKKINHPLRSVFTSVGLFDIEIPYLNTSLLKEARIFDQKLDSMQIEHRYLEYNDGHRDSNWNQSLDDILIQFFRK